MPERRMILVLGPHRSGTSAVTAALGMLGAQLALPDIYANTENAKGFFEQPEVLQFDERLLTALGGAWDAPDFDCAAALATCSDAPLLRSEAVALIRRLFGDASLACMKDPRQCVLLPFWVDVLGQAGFDKLDCVHVLRDPVEVALSQRTRVQQNPEYYEIGRNLAEGAALWLSYSCQQWQEFGAARHVLIAYDSLVDQPDLVLTRLAKALDLQPDPVALDRFRTDFIDPSLRRSHVTATQRAEIQAVLPQAAAAYHLLQPLADGRGLAAENVAPVLALWADLATAQTVTGIMAPVAARLSQRHRQASLQATELAEKLAESGRSAAAIQSEADRVAAALQVQIAEQTTAFQAEQARLIVEYEGQVAGARAERDNWHEATDQKTREIDALTSSTSWRVTRPLRSLGLLARRGKRVLGQGWTGLNRLARPGYRFVARRSPRTAEAIRNVLSPILHMGNRALLNRDFVPMTAHRAGQTAGGRVDLMAYQQAGRPKIAAPLVTVIVPNYNHAPYLRKRLESVFSQTYTNFEVILMDDCSKDESRSILTEYADRYADRTRVLFNDTNSGGAFFQWEKGIAAARGDLIWVAESDDWCSPNFLDVLVPFFANPGVQMAYAPSSFMNHDGTEQVWSMAEYLADLGPDRWSQPFVLPAPIIVREAFAAKNIIPNASSAVFRRPDRLDVLENDIWRGMRTSGDWVLYLNLIRGGLLAYSPAAQNYFRQHPANTSVGSFSEDRYYAEHMAVAKTVQRHYRVDPAIFARQRQDLRAHWLRNRGKPDAAFDATFDLAEIAAEAAKRKPTLLMACYAFISGGGETFPITLANLMKTAGYTVTFLDCAQEPEVAGIRGLLARDIPVVSNFEDLTGIVQDFGIEVIHSHHAWTDSTILDLLPENSPAQTVITLHGMYETIAEPQLKRMLPRLVRRTGRMVYIADKNIQAVTSSGGIGPQDMVKIGNALPRGAGTAVPRADLGIAEDAFVMTIVSRGIPEKGWAEAVQAVGLAREMSGREIQLVIVGDGPEYDRLAPAAPDYAHFVGFRANTRDYFASADLGLLPSRFKGESFPLVLIDCLNAGRPVLASDLGEVRAMLTTPAGMAGEIFALDAWQVPVQALAETIARLANDPDALAAMTARVAAAADQFDPTAMRDAYDAVYRAACQTVGKDVAA